jgi:hypothetical protein
MLITQLAQLETLGEMIMLVGVVLMTVILMMSVRKRIRRGTAESQLTPHEKIERIKQTHGMKDDMRTMMVELEDLTRRFSAQLDAKAIRLEKLIEEADRRIAALGGPSAADNPIAGAKMIGKAASKSTTPSTAAQPHRVAASTLVSPDEPMDRAIAKVYELADAGRSPVEIAGDLKEQVGKIELILALRRT